MKNGFRLVGVQRKGELKLSIVYLLFYLQHRVQHLVFLHPLNGHLQITKQKILCVVFASSVLAVIGALTYSAIVKAEADLPPTYNVALLGTIVILCGASMIMILVYNFVRAIRGLREKNVLARS